MGHFRWQRLQTLAFHACSHWHPSGLPSVLLQSHHSSWPLPHVKLETSTPVFLVGWISAKISGRSSFSSLRFDHTLFSLAHDGHPDPLCTRLFT